jgi:outer membrane receptor protein involved in Fe transport
VVWGANALTGVVNIITKSPREAEGIRLDLSLGRLNRDAGSRQGQGDGSAYGGSFSLSRAPNDRLSYRVSAGYFHSDPYSRPVGVTTLRDPLTGATFPCPGAPETGCVPLDTHPLDSTIVTGGAPYPIDGPGARGLAFSNSPTDQPRVEVRVDQDLAGGGRFSYSGGYSGTSGIMHTGIGPFDIQKGSYMGFGRVAYTKGAFHVAGYSNFFDVDAPNLLLEDPLTGEPVELSFKTKTYDLEVGDSRVLGGNQILTYGGNVRRNDFEITLTPNARNRTELGLYLEDEIYWDRVRFSLGARVDKFGNIEDPVFSPRLSAMFKPTPNHSLRVSFNRAFRAPSAVHNYLEQDIYAPGVDPIDLTPLLGLCSVGGLPADLCSLVPTEPVPVIVRNAGNPDLKQESVTAFEVAYTGTVAGRTTLGLSFFQNDIDDSLNFVNITPSPTHPEGLPGFDVYTPEIPPPGIPGPLYGFLLQQGFLDPIPRTVTTYLNLGPIRQRGLELSIDHRVSRGVWASANYSFQGTPKVLKADPDQIPYPTEEVGVAPRHRVNAEVRFDTDRLFGSATFNYTGWAFWQDVLTLPYHGRTDAFTMLNASLGVRLADGRLSAVVRGTNLANKTIQQHIFGDILKRSVFLELRLNLD